MDLKHKFLIAIPVFLIALIAVVGFDAFRSGSEGSSGTIKKQDKTTETTTSTIDVEAAAAYAAALEAATTTTTAAPPPVAPPCSSFASQAEAQTWHDENKDAFQTHVSHFDSDGDGKPCTAVCYADCQKTKKAEQKSKANSNAPAPAVSGGSVWDRLAQCESGGNWSINTGNGYHGGLQFLPATWNAYGGREFAAYAYQASRGQQIAVAERVLADVGWRAWPACSRKLGLR